MIVRESVRFRQSRSLPLSMPDSEFKAEDLEHEKNGADRVTRTPDPRITNALLYQLSYIGTRKRREV